jgi:cell division protein FtsB
MSFLNFPILNIFLHKIRAAAPTLSFYAVALLLVGYFFAQANSGLQAKVRIQQESVALNQELLDLQSTRIAWEQKVKLLGGESIERDMLDERSRAVLGWVHKNDAVIMLGQ